MLAALSRHYVLRVLISRALVIFVLVTLVVSALRIDLSLGVVLLVGVLGWIDVRRRHESLFWANLGYGAWQTTGVFFAVAIAGETIVATIIQPLVESAFRSAR